MGERSDGRMGRRLATGLVAAVLVASCGGGDDEDAVDGSGGGAGGARPTGGSTYVLDGDERCGDDGDGVGCARGEPATRGDTFTKRGISYTYRGGRVIEGPQLADRTFGEAEEVDGFRYLLYFDLRFDEFHGRWGDDLFGTALGIEPAVFGGSGDLTECSEVVEPILPAMSQADRLPTDGTITVRLCAFASGSPEDDPLFELTTGYDDVTFRFDDADGDAADDVVTTFAVIRELNPDASDSDLGEELARAEADS